MRVPLFDTSSPLEPLLPRLLEVAGNVLRSGSFILGPEVAAFEEEWAARVGAARAVGVANGTEAITIALRALGVGPGDEVVVPSFTFYASAEAIPPTGATPVFCDVDADTFCVTPETVRAALTPRTKAVIAVDLFGNVAPTAEIAELGLPVVEDAAQAAGSTRHGRAAGSFGRLSTFSFFPSKNLPACGDAGAIVTSDDALASAVRMLRFHGSRDKVTYEQVGYNSRLDELQAALLRVMLPHLEEWSDGRRAAARAYRDCGLGALATLPTPTESADPAWHLYVIRHPEAERLAARLADDGIESRGYYRTPVHRQPAMARYAANVALPVTDELAETHLAIPISPRMGGTAVEQVVQSIRAAT